MGVGKSPILEPPQKQLQRDFTPHEIPVVQTVIEHLRFCMMMDDIIISLIYSLSVVSCTKLQPARNYSQTIWQPSNIRSMATHRSFCGLNQSLGLDSNLWASWRLQCSR